MRPRILIFDDDELLLRLLRRVINRKNYEIITFHDPSECQLYINKKCECVESEICADIIITDLKMPKVNGIEFIKSQKEKGCKAENIAIMSSDFYSNTLQEAKELGCKIFEKPFEIKEFTKWLDECENNIDEQRKLLDL